MFLPLLRDIRVFNQVKYEQPTKPERLERFRVFKTPENSASRHHLMPF